MEVLTKKCARCRVSKTADKVNFPLHNRTSDGFDSWCRECRKEYRNANSRGKFRHVISDEDLIILKASSTACAICYAEEKLVVYHDHKTHQVRGMLCNHCNRGLGHFRDNPVTLRAAALYLENSWGY